MHRTSAANLESAIKPKNTVPRVFVLETKQNVDISRAIEHGPIVPIFDGNERKPAFVDADFIDVVIDKLEAANYNPTVDYILVVGHLPSACILVGTVMREFVESEKDLIKLLVWNSWYDRYVCIEI